MTRILWTGPHDHWIFPAIQPRTNFLADSRYSFSLTEKPRCTARVLHASKLCGSLARSTASRFCAVVSFLAAAKLGIGLAIPNANTAAIAVILDSMNLSLHVFRYILCRRGRSLNCPWIHCPWGQ